MPSSFLAKDFRSTIWVIFPAHVQLGVVLPYQFLVKFNIKNPLSRYKLFEIDPQIGGGPAAGPQHHRGEAPGLAAGGHGRG